MWFQRLGEPWRSFDSTNTWDILYPLCPTKKKLDNPHSPRATTPVPGVLGECSTACCTWEEVTGLMEEEQVVGGSFTKEVIFYRWGRMNCPRTHNGGVTQWDYIQNPLPLNSDSLHAILLITVCLLEKNEESLSLLCKLPVCWGSLKRRWEWNPHSGELKCWWHRLTCEASSTHGFFASCSVSYDTLPKNLHWCKGADRAALTAALPSLFCGLTERTLR